MPAKSESQQRLMALVYQYKDIGKLPDNTALADKVKKTAASITMRDAKAYASTKHENLPDRVNETISFKHFLQEEWKQ